VHLAWADLKVGPYELEGRPEGRPLRKLP